MEFFKTINLMLGEGNTLSLNVAKKGDTLTVSVLPGNDIVKDAAKNKIQPLSVSGTADELDDGFLAAIAPVEKATGLLNNMADYEKSVAEAEKSSKMEQEKKSAEDKRRKEFLDYIELAKTNMAADKFRDALTCVEAAKKLASGDAEMKLCADTRKDVDDASGINALFGAKPDKSDGKNIKPGANAGKKAPAKKASDDDNDEEESGEEVDE